MATIAQNLIAISDAKTDLADNLTTKGVASADTEPLADLVGKVLDIPTGGGGTTLDLHCQVAEPSATSGLWVKKAFTPASTVIAASRFFNDPLTDNTWGTRAAMTTARSNLTASVVSDIIYVIGGTDTSYSNKNEAYDPDTNTWSTKATMTTARERVCAGVVNGIIYVIGGLTATVSNLNEAYDPATNTWSTKATMTTARRDLCSGVVNGIIYVIGGSTGTVSNLNEAYDPATNTWSTKATMTTARLGLSAGVVNGIIYVIGGSSTLSRENEAYDPATNTWSTKANLPTPRYFLAAGVVNGIIYVIGGNPGTGTLSNKNEAYNPATNAWSTTRANLTTARERLCAGVVDSIIYCIGGFISAALNLNEAYSPIGSTVAENTLVIDCSVGTNQVDLINVTGTRLTVPVTSVGVGDSAGLLKKTASAWYNGTAWTDIP